MDTNVRYIHLPPESEPPSLGTVSVFKAILILEQPTSDLWQKRVSDWLVRSGCLYMMAWGERCSSWDDSVDLSNLEKFGFGDVPDDQFVMTTWHPNEPLSEVFWFSEHAAFHPSITLTDTIVMDIHSEEREAAILKDYRNAQILGS